MYKRISAELQWGSMKFTRTALMTIGAFLGAVQPLKVFGCVALIATIASVSVHAQQSPMNGTWYGLIDGYTYSDPRRVFKVTTRDQKTACTWDEVGKTNDYPAACTISGDTVELKTGAGSTIRLVQSGSTLSGTFALKNGQAFPVVLGRTEEAMSVRPATTSSRSAQQQSLETPKNVGRLQQCGQSVIYSTREPSADVPANVRAFVGAWLGSWDSGLCSAIAVDDVRANGMVSVAYVYGSLKHLFGDISPSNLRFPGQITGNTLTTGNGRGILIEYIMLNPTQLSGTYRRGGSIGPSNGNFTRTNNIASASRSAKSGETCGTYHGFCTSYCANKTTDVKGCNDYCGRASDSCRSTGQWDTGQEVVFGLPTLPMPAVK